MSEEKKEIVPITLPELPDNSYSGKAEVAKKLKKTSSKVTVKSQSATKQALSSFVEEDAKDVGTFVLIDVIIPALKTMTRDIIVNGVEMFLYGGRESSLGERRVNSRTYTSYGSYYDRGGTNKNTPPWENERRYKPQQTREQSNRIRIFNAEDYLFPSRAEAEDVLDILLETIDDYGVLSLADFYEILGVTSDFTDNKYGWADLSRVSVRQSRQGFWLTLNRPKPLH